MNYVGLIRKWHSSRKLGVTSRIQFERFDPGAAGGTGSAHGVYRFTENDLGLLADRLWVITQAARRAEHMLQMLCMEVRECSRDAYAGVISNSREWAVDTLFNHNHPTTAWRPVVAVAKRVKRTATRRVLAPDGYWDWSVMPNNSILLTSHMRQTADYRKLLPSVLDPEYPVPWFLFEARVIQDADVTLRLKEIGENIKSRQILTGK